MRFFSCIWYVPGIKNQVSPSSYEYLTYVRVCMYVLSGTWYERTWYQLRIPVVHAYSYEYKYEYGLQVHSLSLWHFPSCLCTRRRDARLLITRDLVCTIRYGDLMTGWIGDTCMGDPYGDLRQDVTGRFRQDVCMCRYISYVRVYEFIRHSPLVPHWWWYSYKCWWWCIIVVLSWRTVVYVLFGIHDPAPRSTSYEYVCAGIRVIYEYLRQHTALSRTLATVTVHPSQGHSRWARSFIFTQGCVHARMLILVCWPISRLRKSADIVILTTEDRFAPTRFVLELSTLFTLL